MSISGRPTVCALATAASASPSSGGSSATGTYLQHALPTGFMKVRYDGFLSPSFSTSLEQLKVAWNCRRASRCGRARLTPSAPPRQARSVAQSEPLRLQPGQAVFG